MYTFMFWIHNMCLDPIDPVIDGSHPNMLNISKIRSTMQSCFAIQQTYWQGGKQPNRMNCM